MTNLAVGKAGGGGSPGLALGFFLTLFVFAMVPPVWVGEMDREREEGERKRGFIECGGVERNKERRDVAVGALFFSTPGLTQDIVTTS